MLAMVCSPTASIGESDPREEPARVGQGFVEAGVPTKQGCAPDSLMRYSLPVVGASRSAGVARSTNSATEPQRAMHYDRSVICHVCASAVLLLTSVVALCLIASTPQQETLSEAYVSDRFTGHIPTFVAVFCMGALLNCKGLFSLPLF